MYKNNNKQSEIDALYAEFGNKNVFNSKSKALEEKYWSKAKMISEYKSNYNTILWQKN